MVENSLLEDLNLVEIVQEIVECLAMGGVSLPPRYYLLVAFFHRRLKTASAEQIREAIKIGNWVQTGIDFWIVSDMYQRLILVEEDRKENFSEFADFLRSGGPTWDYLAEYFDRVALRA
ncbi:MAG: hypothetical protein RLZZ156_1099 [Deinococcota bacterium]|jgi:hypothetical protein